MPVNLTHASATSIAPYINDTMQLAEQWKLVAGLRYDTVRRAHLELAEPARVGEPDVNYTSVRAGFIYEPTPVQSYYLSYGTSFNPSLETLALTNGQQSLDPETSASVRARRQVGGDERRTCC